MPTRCPEWKHRVLSICLLRDLFRVACNIWCPVCILKALSARKIAHRHHLVLPWIDRDKKHDRKLLNRFISFHITFLNHPIGTS